MLYKNFQIKYDEVAKDYVLSVSETLVLTERFSCLSYAYDYIDSLDLSGAF